MKEDILERLDEIIGQHAERMNGLQDAQMEILKGQGEIRVLQGLMVEQITELRRDTQHNQRMWAQLAQKHG